MLLFAARIRGGRHKFLAGIEHGLGAHNTRDWPPMRAAVFFMTDTAAFASQYRTSLVRAMQP